VLAVDSWFAVQIGASKVYIEDLRRDFLDNYITPSIQANGARAAQSGERFCDPAKLGRSLGCDSACVDAVSNTPRRQRVSLTRTVCRHMAATSRWILCH